MLTDDDFTRFRVGEVVLVLTIIAGFAYLGFRYVNICMTDGSKLWRSQMYLIFSVFFIFTIGLFLVSNSFSIFNYSGQKIILVFTLINTYVIYLQYMYTLTRGENKRLGAEPGDEQITVGTMDIADINLDEDHSIDTKQINKVREHHDLEESE